MKIKVLKIWKIQRLLLNIENIYKNIEECNQSRKFHALIVFDDMIADVISSKELSPIATEQFIRGRKLNISTAFITKSFFSISKDVKLPYPFK